MQLMAQTSAKITSTSLPTRNAEAFCYPPSFPVTSLWRG